MIELDYMQRKALRRLGRGQSVSHSMLSDPVIKACYDWPEVERPPEGLDVVAWCDWEARVRGTRPRINEHGKKLLKGLDNGPRAD